MGRSGFRGSEVTDGVEALAVGAPPLEDHPVAAVALARTESSVAPGRPLHRSHPAHGCRELLLRGGRPAGPHAGDEGAHEVAVDECQRVLVGSTLGELGAAVSLVGLFALIRQRGRRAIRSPL
jgi:hypothetical protein